MHAKSLQSCLTLCNPLDCSLPGFFVRGISQARILEWAAISLSSNSSAATAAKSLQSCPTLCDPIDGSPTGSTALGFSRQEHWSGLPFSSPMHESETEVTQSCLTLRDPMDCSLPGSCVHGIFQARVLEWVVMAFSL